MSQSAIFQSPLVLARPALFRSSIKAGLVPKGTQIEAHIARVGTFKGYRGGEFSLTRALFDRMIANFESDKNPLPVYRGHADLGLTPKGEEPIASGWILSLTRKGDDLWSLLELTDDLASEIKAGQFRFTSIYVRPQNLHRETGKEIGARMVSLAITNQPFIDGLEPLALSAHEILEGVATYTQKEMLSMVKKQLKLSEAESTETETEAESEAPALDMEALEALRVKASEHFGEDLDLTSLLERLSAMLDASEEPASEETSETETEVAASSHPAFLALKAELDETRKVLSVLSAEKTKREKAENEALIDKAIENGQILDVARAHWVKSIGLNKELTLSMLGSMQAVNTGKIIEASAKDTEKTSEHVLALSAHEQLILKGAMGQ